MTNTFLIVEDDPVDIELINCMLLDAYKEEIAIESAGLFKEVLPALKKQKVTAILLDLNLPDQSGLANLKGIVEAHPTIPIIILTGHDDPEVATEALNCGAQDYLPKAEVTTQLLLRSIRYACQRKQTELDLKRALKEADYRNRLLEDASKHDFLTQLPNRKFFDELASAMISRASRESSSHTLAVIYFDLNNFKKINDIYGHSIGDLLLIEVAQRAEKSMREYDVVCRIGGDEFVAIADQLENTTSALTVAARLKNALAEPVSINNHTISLDANIGISTFPESDSVELLVRHADLAMCEAKSNNEKTICYYNGELEELHHRRVEIEKNIPYGLQNHEFFSCYQPVINLSNAEPLGVEALLRWNNKELGFVPPDEFISIAESCELIDHLTYALLQSIHKFHQMCQDNSIKLGKIAINVAARQFANRDFAASLLESFNKFNLSKDVISIELTERQFIQNIGLCREQLQLFQDNGIQIALDDFGTGFSSLTHLMELPIDCLKLDRKLIDNIDNNERNQALTIGMIEMAHHLNQVVVAEGIEREEECRLLKNLGCDYIQGYWVERPLKDVDAVEFFKNWNSMSQYNIISESGS